MGGDGVVVGDGLAAGGLYLGYDIIGGAGGRAGAVNRATEVR